MSEARPVSVTGLSILTALGRGPEAQLTGAPAFTEVRRFDTSNRRVRYAAMAAETGTLEEELDLAIATACAQAGVDRSTTPLLLALHSAPACDFGQRRIYTSACVSASTALAAAGTLISTGRADRIVVAAAYLVEPHQFALFDAGRALADDNTVRPFSLNRRGLLLGDGVAAVVLQAGDGLAELLGWSRTGDAYHPCQPSPDGRGLATAIRSALVKAGVPPDAISYLNANATGTPFADAAEAAAINTVFSSSPPVSSTKGLHGHALEASGLVEFVVTVQALREGKLPVNAGFLEPDPACSVDLILAAPRPATSAYGMTVNSAFGGANTALVVRAG
ncbi:beta-ketoacyl synthase N-terminal-like domain-containing protein [Kribbella sp. NBC_00889]|uniref:beta-ketoacyl synthase N-terminal-like domain-containing protein n=1 Tax=Kribbella sp. NBC_00889 TaxID=2975974 RepID=UPI0038653303|nr:beta-ketoacyl-[acyl-carrier-protein] synthase family protein [Kribbella sp. NBC_00889]